MQSVLSTLHWIALIILLLATAGMADRAVFLKVSGGTINRLIFYASILRANHPVFFPHQSSHSFLSIFIAWINLDLGIRPASTMNQMPIAKLGSSYSFLCTFGSLSQLLLQSATTPPWRVSKLIGNNVVQVLRGHPSLFLLFMLSCSTSSSRSFYQHCQSILIAT